MDPAIGPRKPQSVLGVRLGVWDRLAYAQKTLEIVRSSDYIEWLQGTIGVQPLKT